METGFSAFYTPTKSPARPHAPLSTASPSKARNAKSHQTFTVAPFALVVCNLDIAKRESGFGAKILAGANSGSVDAINANGDVFHGGLSGGEGSVFRKNIGIRF